MNRFSYCIVGLLASVAFSCGGEGEDGIPVNPVIDEIAKQCGLACPGKTGADGVVIKGVVDGNVAISGVAQVDAFFASVNNFRGAADGVSAGIEAQLKAIKADFGIAAGTTLEAGLTAQVKANVEGALVIDYEPARCAVDATATVEATARCEAKVMPPQVELECKGSCDIEAGAELRCDASAELQCEFTGPTVDCQGTCEGSCEAMLTAAASCEGVCRGSCDGSCSAYSDQAATKCAGTCSGKCMGSCEAKLAAAAKCMGTCKGSCNVSGPDAKCEGSAHASCKAKANASVMCKGKCEGEFVPPEASAECKASAKAEAKLNVQCTPPRLAASYKLKAGVDAMAQAKFEGALKTLVQVRLPALLQISARANSVASAGEDLIVSADTAVKASIKGAIDSKLSVKMYIGLGCALGELPKVEAAITDSAERLNENLMATVAVTKSLGM